MLELNVRVEGIEELIQKYHVRASTIVKSFDFVTKKNAEKIRVIGKERAPWLTGTLSRSIDKERKEPMVWAVFSELPYARIRNYINNKHPQTIGYLTKTLFEQREPFTRDLKEAVQELKKL